MRIIWKAHLLGKCKHRQGGGVTWSSPCNDGVKLAGCSPCGRMSAGLYCQALLPL